MTEVFAPMIGPWNVEQAVLTVLKEWMPTYLAELERENGLTRKALGRPPAPESYHGGLDWQSVIQDRCPEVIVICNPLGEPERSANFYMQNFEVQVGCVVFSEEGSNPEDHARRNAGLFATATMLLGQHGKLSWSEGLASIEETLLVGAPKVEFHESEDRRVAVGITSWHIFTQILDPNSGPVTVKAVEPEEQYPEWPTATSDVITVKGEPVETPL